MTDDDIEDLLYLLEDGKQVRYVDHLNQIHKIMSLQSHHLFLGGREEEPAIKDEEGRWIAIRNVPRSSFVFVTAALPDLPPLSPEPSQLRQSKG